MDAVGSNRYYNWDNNYRQEQNTQVSRLVEEAQTLTGEVGW